MKDLSKIIREFEKLPYKSYEMRRPKNEPIDSYFYLARQLAELMTRDDVLNLHVERLFYRQDQIRIFPSGNFSAVLFYGQGRIKTHDRR